MDDTFRYEARPGSLGLSLLALGGLILLAAQLWEIMPGFVLLIFIPALLLSIAQLIVTPVFGLRVSDAAWFIETGRDVRELPLRDIAHLRLTDGSRGLRAVLVMIDGAEIELPQVALPDPLVLIREATNRGIPVRQS